MAVALPRFIVIKSVVSGHYAHSLMSEVDRDYVCREEENVFNPYVKMEVEKAKIDNKLVHLRFCYSNKYWVIKHDPDAVDEELKWIVASSDQPEEDTCKLSCTMFEPTPYDAYLYFRHVQSGELVQTRYLDDATVPFDPDKCFCIDGLRDEGSPSISLALFSYVDRDTLVIMPKYVAFKGYNDKYLTSSWFQKHEYLDFSSEDCCKETTAYEVTMKPDGHFRIKSRFFDKFWRRGDDWIWGDSTDDVGDDIDTLFWPIKLDNNTIALRNAGNGRFCSSLTTEGMTDCFNAAVPTITTEARLKVEELVLEREITDVVYRMDHARIFNETPFVAGTGAATNNSQETSHLTIRLSYQVASSCSFNNGLSINAGVRTNIRAGFPSIVEGSIEISAEGTKSLEWNKTTTETKTADATYEAAVPPMSTIKVNYVATQGTCNVPFSYTQRDKLSTDGSFVNTWNIDGVYTGVNYYSFRFEQNVVEVGMKINKNTVESMTPRRCSACVFN